MFDIAKYHPNKAESTFKYGEAWFTVGGMNYSNPNYSPSALDAYNNSKDKDEEVFEVQLLSRLVTEWGGFVIDGEQPECTLGEKIKVFERFHDLRKSILMHAQNRSNYTQLVEDASGN